MDLSTAVTLVQLFKQVVQEFIKHNNFVAVFTEAGKRMVELEADRNSDVSEKIKILFSKENMERLAKDCENLNGYELLDYVNDFLREFFNSEDLKYIDIERVIKVFNGKISKHVCHTNFQQTSNPNLLPVTKIKETQVNLEANRKTLMNFN